MFKFTSEPGIDIVGNKFKLRVDYVLVDGEMMHTERAVGQDVNTGGWFFVPPKERARLEQLGVTFDQTG